MQFTYNYESSGSLSQAVPWFVSVDANQEQKVNEGKNNVFFNRKKCCSLILGDIALNSSKIQTQKHDKKFDLKSRAQQRYMLFFLAGG